MNTLLEDDFNDILQKAAEGLSLSSADLITQSGVDELSLKQLFSGKFDESNLRKIAPLLDLRAYALCLIAQNAWHPQKHSLSGLWQISSTYKSMEVNAYLVKIPGTGEAILFDTGTNALAIKERLAKESLTLSAIFLTHTHSDHVAALDELIGSTGQPVIYAPSLEPIDRASPLNHENEINFNTLNIEARLTHGHSRGGMSYIIKGLEAILVAIVGDAIFAGSMGRGFISYKDALQSNKAQILSLPPSTVLCPGHGPMTSVEEELEHNPFF